MKNVYSLGIRFDTVSALNTKEHILEAACSLLERDGEAQFRLSAVAKKVKIREASIYHHFSSRGDLLEQAQLMRYRDTYIHAVDPLRTALNVAVTVEQWELAFRQVLNDAFSERGVKRRSTRSSVLGLAQANSRVRKQIVVVHRELFTHMTAIVREAQSRNWITSKHRAEVVAPIVMGAIAGRTLVEIDRDFADLENWDEAATELILGFMRP